MTQPGDAIALRDSIVAAPHWKVVVRPTAFDEKRLPTLGDCWRVMEAANVQVRGWDFPHVDYEGRSQGQDFIQSWVEFRGERSFWRLYQSGLFAHVFAFREDSFDDELVDRARGRVRIRDGFQPSGYVDFINVLYTLTEAFEFSSRLVERLSLESGAIVEVSMEHVARRLLVSFDISRLFHDFFPAGENQLSFRWDGPSGDLISGAPQLARAAAAHFYERFGWLDPPDSLLQDEQAQFLERRRGARAR